MKRSILKNKISEGGLNITDVDCLNKPFKFRQFVRAVGSSYPIKKFSYFAWKSWEICCETNLPYNNQKRGGC